MSTSATQFSEIVWLQLNWTILQFATAITSSIINGLFVFLKKNVGIDSQYKEY